MGISHCIFVALGEARSRFDREASLQHRKKTHPWGKLTKWNVDFSGFLGRTTELPSSLPRSTAVVLRYRESWPIPSPQQSAHCHVELLPALSLKEPLTPLQNRSCCSCSKRFVETKWATQDQLLNTRPPDQHILLPSAAANLP